jgi:glycosyltransferase involved in cell wall biosynthesis
MAAAKNVELIMSDQSPLTSIIVRTYNRASTILRSLDSVRRQTSARKEIIVVDDGSSDGTKEIISALPEIRYHWQPNQGTWGALQTGLELATGEFVSFLDSDDEWNEDFLENSIGLLQRFGAGFCFSNYRLLDSSRNQLRNLLDGTPMLRKYLEGTGGETAHHLSPEEVRAIYLRYIPSPMSALVIRRSLAKTGWIGKTNHTSEDWNLVLKMVFEQNVDAVIETRPLWTKWLHGGNIAEGRNDILSYCALRTSDREFMLLNYGQSMTQEERRYISKELADLNYECAYKVATVGRWRESLRHYAASFHYRPSIRPIVSGLKSMVRAALVMAGFWPKPTYDPTQTGGLRAYAAE